jgi:putative transposase
MSRLPRYFVEGLPLHIIVRGNDRMPVFRYRADFSYFKSTLLEASQRHRLAIHAYVLMPNHVHLLATPADAASAPKVMQSVGRRYVYYFNRRYQRTGTLWEGRYRATAVDTDSYLFECMRYIELNPVRAAMTVHPRKFPWSSYRANAQGRPDPLITPHELYCGLGVNQNACTEAYRAMVEHPLQPETLDLIRQCTNKGWALGGTQFSARLEGIGERRASPRRPIRGNSERDRPEVGQTEAGHTPIGV